MKKYRILKLLSAAVLLCAVLTGCLPREVPMPSETAMDTLPAPTVPAPIPSETVPTEPEPTLSPARRMLQSMTLAQKVGQLFVVCPEHIRLPGFRKAPDQMTESELNALAASITSCLRENPVGGIIFFAANIQSPQQLSAWQQMLSRSGEIPLFLAVDEEGGRVARLANHKGFDLPRYPSAAAVGSSGNPEDAGEMGSTIGTYLRQYGFNMDFAPVADVHTNPKNPVIGDRSFSSDPVMAARMARAAADGLTEAGIIPVFKHFPGHGDTAEDSHAGIAVVHKSKEQLQNCEWIPFRQARETDCIMAGHIAVPSITGDLTPATLSREVITGILREELGFPGLIITDSLSMGAITERFSSGDAALAALRAGCDLLLMPKDFQQAFQAVLSAVESEDYPEEALNRTVERILEFKFSRLTRE